MDGLIVSITLISNTINIIVHVEVVKARLAVIRVIQFVYSTMFDVAGLAKILVIFIVSIYASVAGVLIAINC
jgi:hypothetical protein